MDQLLENPALQAVRPGRAVDVAELGTSKNGVKRVATSGNVGWRFVKAVDLAPQALQARADGMSVGQILVAVVSPNLTLKPFGRDLKIALLGVHGPTLRQVL